MLDGGGLVRRRELMFGLGALSLAGCATGPSEPPLSLYEASAGPFFPVNVARENILETVTGLRPDRAGGFRLEAELFGDKIVVHNYGHDGDGVTLSWGCATIASEMALAIGSDDIAIIGAGVQGLTTALLLARAGKKMTIYAADFPPNTTSNIAGALILTGPRYGAVPADVVARVNALAEAGFRPYVGKPGYGVAEVRYHNLRCRNEEDRGARALFGCDVQRQFSAIVVDMNLYLDRLFDDFRAAGGRAYTQRFEGLEQVISLPQSTIVNCSGLGAGALFGDASVRPVWGQLVRLHPQPEIDYAYISRGRGGLLYMFPRETSIVLGGTRRPGRITREPDPEDINRLLAGHSRLAERAARTLRVMS